MRLTHGSIASPFSYEHCYAHQVWEAGSDRRQLVSHMDGPHSEGDEPCRQRTHSGETK